MADDKPGGSDLKTAFVFVKHGDPPPTEWMAAHPGWVKFPATPVPRPAENARPGRASLPVPGAEPGSVESGTARPVSMGAPMVQRPGLRNRGRPPPFPGRFGPDDGQGAREDPVAAYLRVTESLAAMGLVEPVAAWRGRPQQGAYTKGAAAAPAVPTAPKVPLDVNANLHVSTEGQDFIFQRETQGHLDRTEHLYWPGQQSGVTLGAGYDFRHRLPEQIVENLTSIGIDPATAQTLSVVGAGKDSKGDPIKNGGLHGPAAGRFADKHINDITLTEQQQRSLFLKVLSIYEDDVRKNVQVTLSQNDFDALVSFDFSRGHTNFMYAVGLLNSGQRPEAISFMRHLDDHRGAGLASRRQAEADTMLRPDQPGAGTKGGIP